jgi:polygalacturonase
LLSVLDGTLSLLQGCVDVELRHAIVVREEFDMVVRCWSLGVAGIVATALGSFACGGSGTSLGSGSSPSGSTSGSASSGGSGSSGSVTMGSGGSTNAGASGTGSGGACGAGDANMPPEPTIPPACATLQASQPVAPGNVPSESTLDTARIQAALNSCMSGQAVKLIANGANNGFVIAPLILPSGVTLWIDAGTTLYGTRNPSAYGTASALIAASGANSGIVGDGIIDGQGGEPKIGQSGSFWDANGSGGSSPALVRVSGATNFTMYGVTLHNSPMFHVKLDASGFVVWGITIKTPSKSTNSQGAPLTPSNAHNTDGIDPGEAASNGYIVCSNISDGDDQIAIKGGIGVSHLTIAHNHFGAGHGMSIGSETNGGVSDINVYDLSIDGTNSGMGGGSSNGIRIKSSSAVGGPVTNVTYSDVCVRDLVNPIILNPRYSSATGGSIPTYDGITIRNFHSLSSSVTPTVTLDGYDASHLTSIVLDNVVVDGVSGSNVKAMDANVTLGPGNVNFKPAGTNVNVTDNISATSQSNACAGKWVAL